MIADVKVKWIEALRSGKYKQGKGCLRSNEDEYCCLGVLCDVLGIQWEDRGTPDAEAPLALYRYGVRDAENDLLVSVPGEDTRERVGIDSENWSKLWQMNDSGSSFDAIADYIEQTL